MITEFTKIYNVFYSKITDDMYMELDEAQTEALMEELLLNAIPWFEFPRVNIHDYDLNFKNFNVELSYEEINILAIYMVVEWIKQQLASVEKIRMKFSGSDFKFTSQANHIAKLISLEKEYERQGFHLQRLYKRRKFVNGVARSTFGAIMGNGVTTTSGSGSNSGGGSSGGDHWEDLPSLPEDGGMDEAPFNPSDQWEDLEDLSLLSD